MNILIARKAIMDDLKRRGKERDPNVKPNDKWSGDMYHDEEATTPAHYYTGAGIMDCPVCKTGKLKYSRSSYNGHIHAACTTVNCVAWME